MLVGLMISPSKNGSIPMSTYAKVAGPGPIRETYGTTDHRIIGMLDVRIVSYQIINWDIGLLGSLRMICCDQYRTCLNISRTG